LKPISIRLLLLSLIFSISCNKVREIPEPDFFADKTELPEMTVQVVGDSAEIDLLAHQAIDFPVTIEFGNPAHGEILPKSDGRKFLYRPAPGFSGTDTLPYKICRSAECRGGKIYLEILPDPSICFPVYSNFDTTYYSLNSGPGNRSIPLFPGDVYCPSNQKKILSFLPGINKITISDSIRFSSSYSKSQRREFLMAYSNADARGIEKKRCIKLALVPESSFCDGFFSVANQESSLHLERDEFLVLTKSSFRPLVQVCEGDLDSDYFELTSTPNIGVVPLENDAYKIFYKPYSFQGPAMLFFRYRNIRGIADQGFAKIILH